MTFEFSSLQHVNYGRRTFCFAGPYVWNSLPEHIRQSALCYIRQALQVLTKDIFTPADIAPSVLETMISYCCMGYIIAPTYYYYYYYYCHEAS